MEAAADLHGTGKGGNKKYIKKLNVHDVYVIVLTTLNDLFNVTHESLFILSFYLF